MFLDISDDGVELHQPEVVTDLYASYRKRLTPDRLHQVLVENEAGEMLDDRAHVMLRVDALRRLAEGRVGDGWEDDFAGMLEQARGRGWLSEDGASVRAHLERAM